MTDTTAADAADSPGEEAELEAVEAVLEAATEDDGNADDAGGDDAAQDPAPPPPQDPRDMRIRSLERTLAEREATLHTYIKAHKKAEQEFETFKERMRANQQRELSQARGKIVERLLEVDENLERTIQASLQGGALESLQEGLKLVHRLFVERLTELGLERVDPTGQPFDPTSMEALGLVSVPDKSLDNTVVNTVKAGFRIDGHEVRPAQVLVGRVN